MSLAGFCLIVVVALQTLPYVVRDQLVLWLYEQGVEDARLRTLSVNWWRGQLRLEKLSLQRQGYESLQLEQLVLDVDLAALLDKQLRVEQFQLIGLHGGLSDASGQLWLGPLPLPAAEPESEAAPSEPLDWQVGLDALVISDLAWLTQWQGQQYPLQIDQARIESLYQWAPLTDTLLTLQGRLNNAALVLDSTSQPLQPAPQFKLSLKLDKLPLDGLMAMLEQPLRGQLSSDLQITAQLNPLQVKARGTLGLDTLAWQAAPSAAVGSVRWSGDAGWSGPDAKAVFEGKLSLNRTVATVPDQLALKLAKLGWTGRGTVSLAQGLAGTLDGTLSLANLAAKSADKAAGQSLSLEQAAWRGQATFSQLQDKPLSVNSQQQLTLTGLGATHQSLVASLARLENQSQFELNGEHWQLAQPELVLKGLKAASDQYPLISADQIRLQELLANADSAQLARVELTELKLAAVVDDEQDRPLSYWPQLKLTSIHWQPQQLLIDSIELNGGETRLRRGAEGELVDIVALQQQLASLVPAEAETAAKPVASTEQSPAMHIRLGELSVRQPHQLYFSDRSVKPRFSFNGELSQLAVGPYDTQGKRPTDLNLKAKLNGDGELSLHGVLDTATMQSGGWTLDLNGVEMPYLSPYSMEYTGYFLQSGQLNLTSKGTLKAGQLEGKSTVKLHNFNVEPRQQDKVGQVSQRLSMPLETAVMILEDDDSNIELDLDLSGALDDPNFGYQSVINSLAGRGLKNAAVSYLTKSLQPYATLVSLAKTAIEANEKGTFISLQPVQFAPGKSALSKDMQGYMGKLTEMLAERPAMRLKLCGTAVKADLKVLKPILTKENAKRKKPRKPEALAELLQQRLQTLAVQRGEVVKKQLAKGVPKDRLFICYPTVDSSSDKPPSLSVGI